MMTSAEAHAVLNAARDCQDVERDSITAALRATGDLTQRETDCEQIIRPVGTWEFELVGLPLRPADVFDGLLECPASK